MIKIKDPSLGDYYLEENYQGLRVKRESDSKLSIPVDSFDQGLGIISKKLTLEKEATYTLSEYMEARKKIRDGITKAQEIVIKEEQE